MTACALTPLARLFSAFLVRPDGFVAWATDGEPDLAEIDAALSEWL